MAQKQQEEDSWSDAETEVDMLVDLEFIPDEDNRVERRRQRRTYDSTELLRIICWRVWNTELPGLEGHTDFVEIRNAESFKHVNNVSVKP